MMLGKYNRIMVVLYIIYIGVILANFVYVSVVDLANCRGRILMTKKFLI